MLAIEPVKHTLYDYKYDIQTLNRVVSIYSSENGSPHLTKHIKSWAANKNHIFQLFGNKLKIEQEVDSFLSKKEIEKIILKFCKEIENNIELSLVYDFLYSKISNQKFEEIASNYLEEAVEYFGIKFNSGMKISRILPRLTTKKYSEWIQVEYSKIVQSFSIKGTAVLSIDPIDYITMSENTSGWRSCQALDGEYRTGTLAYMMDNSSIVAYIKTKDIELSYKNDKIFIGDKMWRQMVFIETDKEQLPFAVQSRQYPSKHTSNAGTISQMLINLLNQHTGNEYHMVRESVSELERVVGDINDSNMWYNDIVRGSFNTGRAIIPTTYPSIDSIIRTRGHDAIYVGVEDIPCACGCGDWLEEADYIYYESRYENDDEYYNEDEE